MKLIIRPYILYFGLFFFFSACQEKKSDEKKAVIQEVVHQKDTIETEVVVDEPEELKIPKDFKSQLRPNHKIEISTIYTDTIKYVAYHDEGDEWYFSVKKDTEIIGLIYNNDSIRNFVKGDEVVINWKLDSIRYAGDYEDLNFTEFLVSYKIIKPFALKDQKAKVLWRDDVYDEATKTEVNTIVLNKDYLKNISEPEKAALAYVATFVGNECNTDGKCSILTNLDLGYQCSDRHLEFLKKWFTRDTKVLKDLENCRIRPNTATIQTTFDEISIATNSKDQTILINYKVYGFNMRENSNWRYTKIEKFKYNSRTITLIDSQKIENEPEPLSNSMSKKNNSFVISCGSGCAMTYSENKVVINDNSFEVTFKVEMFVNEVIDETYFQTYIFTCDSANKLEQITLQDNPDFDIESQLPEMQENLRRFVNQICEKKRGG